ncbi:peptidoglycan recognition protein [Streptomyces sp. FXJ1.172]|uniref:peptidoglycan recognition protein family protein n=1 Tax=Streptomyces sp. FXJ1.172 TaxID=710705 RepID=UPI0007CF61C5|nr:peptidoglycan recognition protein [Streptomyces sp. FXJ1.172]WEO97042.1 peptidoglycan recognition protein [Streptomyces sp. FXJ1.172]
MFRIVAMRGFLTSSIGVTCAAMLVLPLTPLTPPTASAAAAVTAAVAAAHPGGTRSLPLVPLSRERRLAAAPEQGLYRAGGERFSLLGVVWDDPGTELHGRVQVRTRSAATRTWSGWQDVGTQAAGHGPDPGSAERTSRRVRGATAPLWVGTSDGVDVRVRATSAAAPGRRTSAGPHESLPSGLRLELVDPGDGTPPPGAPADVPPAGAATGAARAALAANADLTGFGALEIPELDRRATEQELARLRGPVSATPYIGPRPRIVTRRGWGADESLREAGFGYTKKVKAVFLHHTGSGNQYDCSQAPSVIRSIYRYHVASMGWRDIGYDFLVDKCGTIYEGRAGGVAKAVLGAHTLGFNGDSTGIAVIGTFETAKPPGAVVTAIARLTAWKLGFYGGDPRGRTYLTSAGGNLYPEGKNVRLNVISGHRDGFATECPGTSLYASLGTARSRAARYQGR